MFFCVWRVVDQSFTKIDIYSLCKLFSIQLFWLEKHATGWGDGGVGSEGQGLVLFGALLVRHHADQWLHGSAQVIGHVEQTANTGTCRDRETAGGNTGKANVSTGTDWPDDGANFPTWTSHRHTNTHIVTPSVQPLKQNYFLFDHRGRVCFRLLDKRRHAELWDIFRLND